MLQKYETFQVSASLRWCLRNFGWHNISYIDWFIYWLFICKMIHLLQNVVQLQTVKNVIANSLRKTLYIRGYYYCYNGDEADKGRKGWRSLPLTDRPNGIWNWSLVRERKKINI